MSKAYDQLAAALGGVKESAAQLDQVEKMLKDLLQHRQHMAEWKHIKYAHTALLPMTDSICARAQLLLCLCYIQHLVEMKGMLRCMPTELALCVCVCVRACVTLGNHRIQANRGH